MSETVTQPAALNEFETAIDQINIHGLWQMPPGFLSPEPSTLAIPWRWSWEQIRGCMERSADLLPTDHGAERRAFVFMNPGLAPRPGVTQTMAAGFQMFRPGETTPSHRHTAAATRFITYGSGAYTTVGGDRCTLDWGDFIVTPAWIYHDHGNLGDQDVGWFDGIDIPYVHSLNAVFYEPLGGQQVVDKPADHSWKQFGIGALRPTWVSRETAGTYPLLRWHRSAAEEAVHNLVDAGEMTEFDAAAVEYMNPLTGRSCLPTLSCGLQLLPAGFKGKAHRHTSSTVYVVHRGIGHSIVGGQRIDWKEGDTFVVPSWSWHEHVNDSPAEGASLFSQSDIPIFRSAELYREQPLEENGGHQEVRSTFTESAEL